MLQAERHDKIVDIVNERGSVRVTELSRICGVTEETIRRDLDRLEQEGRLRRSHGGAVSVRDPRQQEIPYTEREIMQAEQKRSIAARAAASVRAGERILLDASSTAWYVAQALPDIPLTVLTHSIRVATALAPKENIEVISVGGRLARRSLSFVGPLAERSLEAYHVDKLFFSCKGVHPEAGLSESNELQAKIKQIIIGAADRVILLADATKFGVRAFTHVSGLERVDEIITDRAIDEAALSSLQALGINVIVV